MCKKQEITMLAFSTELAQASVRPPSLNLKGVSPDVLRGILADNGLVGGWTEGGHAEGLPPGEEALGDLGGILPKENCRIHTWFCKPSDSF